jgi:hypothetical protein
LNLMRTCYNKLDTIIKNIPRGICADFDHIKTGTFRVATPDLTRMRTFYNKAATLVLKCWIRMVFLRLLTNSTSGANSFKIVLKVKY